MTSSQALVWDAVPGAASYDVEISTGSLNPPLASFNVTSTSLSGAVLFAGLAHGSYKTKVRAVEPAGPGDWSAVFDTPFDNLPAPTNLRVE